MASPKASTHNLTRILKRSFLDALPVRSFERRRVIVEVRPYRTAFKSNAGFTMVEVLVVICLVAMIAGLGLAMSMDAFRGFSFRNDRDAVVGALQRARSQAINNICLSTGCDDGKAHGVYFDNANKQVVIFQGLNYNSGDTLNEKIQFESKATVITSTSPSVVFDQLSGDSASTTISMADGTYRTATIQINSVGRIDY